MQESTRTIIHIDMDAFYAAIEQRERPELKGKPVIVGSPPDRRGVVCTASYEARPYGVRSAMPSRTAYSRCPHAVFLRPRMSLYSKVSSDLMAILRTFTPMVEKLSVDEAFLDVTSVMACSGDPVALATQLKTKIRQRLGLTSSIGVAPNKFLAKIASDLDKPDGLIVTPFDSAGIANFLAPLPVERIWGVGKTMAGRLNVAALRKIGDIQRMGPDYLRHLVGVGSARQLWALAHGIDDRPVVTEHEEKSISNEETFGVDCSDPAEVRRVLVYLTEKVGRRLRKTGKLAQTAQIKVRFSDFRTLTRQRGLGVATDEDELLVTAATGLFDALEVSEPVRLIGFGVHKLSEAREHVRQPNLFDLLATDSRAKEKTPESLDAALEELRSRYGESIVTRGIPPRKDTARGRDDLPPGSAL